MEDEEILRAKCVRAFSNATSGTELTPEDYKVAVLELLGYKPSKYELSTVWASSLGEEAPSQEGAGLELERFVALMMEKLKKKEESEVIREVFVAMDTCQRGFLTERECLAAFEEVAPLFSKDRAKQLFAEVDSDGDGRVTYTDFEIMMQWAKTQHQK